MQDTIPFHLPLATMSKCISYFTGVLIHVCTVSMYASVANMLSRGKPSWPQISAVQTKAQDLSLFLGQRDNFNQRKVAVIFQPKTQLPFQVQGKAAHWYKITQYYIYLNCEGRRVPFSVQCMNLQQRVHIKIVHIYVI